MTNTATNVSVGKPKVGGSIFTAPLGTTLPTDATTALNAAFENLGYVSIDGVKKTVNRETTAIKAWGGDTVLQPTTGYGESYAFTLIEGLRDVVQKVAHGDANVIGTPDGSSGMTVKGNSQELESRSYVIEEILTGGTLKRTVIPSAAVTAIGEITDNDSTAIGYAVTLGAEPDASGNYSLTYYKAQA